MRSPRRILADWFLRELTRRRKRYRRFVENDPVKLKATIRPGDVVLVDGDQRVSQAVKFLTMSTWSHSALFIGDTLLRRGPELRAEAQRRFGEESRFLILEALVDKGVIASPLLKYIKFNVRICRPVGLAPEDVDPGRHHPEVAADVLDHGRGADLEAAVQADLHEGERGRERHAEQRGDQLAAVKEKRLDGDAAHVEYLAIPKLPFAAVIGHCIEDEKRNRQQPLTRVRGAAIRPCRLRYVTRQRDARIRCRRTERRQLRQRSFSRAIDLARDPPGRFQI